MLEHAGKLFLDPKEIDWRVDHVAVQCSRSQCNPEVIVAIMSGAALFAADLMRALARYEMDPVFLPLRVKRDPRHGTPMMHASDVSSLYNHVAGKRVMLVDTIHDSGHTARYTWRKLYNCEATEISAAFLLVRDMELLPDIPCFTGMDLKKAAEYYYGYGLDLNGKARGLDGIYAVSPTPSVPESLLGAQNRG